MLTLQQVTLDQLEERPARLVVAKALVSRRCLWVPRRDFAWCVSDHCNNLVVSGENLSVNQFRRSLNWLIWRGLAVRFIYDEIRPDVLPMQVVKTHSEERRGFYPAQYEHWEYCPTVSLRKLLGDLPKEISSAA